MTTKPFTDQRATIQPSHWHVFSTGPGTGPAATFVTADPLDESGALDLAGDLIRRIVAEHIRIWDTVYVHCCPADTGCVLDGDGVPFDPATARPYWTMADDDAAIAAQATDDARLALIPPPPGVIADPTEWDWDHDLGMFTRYHTMGRWDVAGDEAGGVRATVDLSVQQTETGVLREWRTGLDGHSLDAMTADEARRLAATLLDAAAALEAGQSQHSEPVA